MKSLIISAAAACGLLLSASATAQGDPAAGKARAAACAACHGADGNSINPEWPNLAGQHASYIATQLKGFQDGWRQNVLMSSMAIGLTATDMANLGAYYAAQPIRPTPADPALLEAGEKLYRVGDAEKNIPACAACHGPGGRGNAPGGMPVIAGQKDAYVIAQLKAYASGERVAATEAQTAMMQQVAKRLSEDDMRALANYLQGLQ